MSTETTEDIANPLPIWLSIPIILVCLAGGGWIIHWYVMTDPVSHDAVLLGNAPTQAAWTPGPGNRRRNAPRQMVQLDPNNGILDVRTEKATARITTGNSKAIFNNAYYNNPGFLPADAHKTLLATRLLVANQKITEALKMDVHQVSRLRGLTNVPMAISPADKAALVSAAQAYATEQANRATAETKLVELLDEVADRSMEGTKQVAIDRAAQIDKLITPEMWKVDVQMGGAGK